jgi:lipoprotein-anchoring transpeptidase ErfK/SrfK
VPLRRTGLLLTPVATGAIALTGWVGPAAAPPSVGASTNAGVSAAERYERVKQRGAPVAVLRRATVLRAAPGGRRLARLGRRTEWGSPRVLATVDRQGTWLKVIATELPNGRYGWVPIGATQLVTNPWAVTADLSTRHVTVTRNGRAVKRFTVAIGSPTTPTPTGRYAVTDKLELMTRSAAYGCCALALSGHQPHVAQGWAGGDRLAIHGTSEPQTIGHAASLGCLRARDRDARWIVKHVFLGTVVEIRP